MAEQYTPAEAVRLAREEARRLEDSFNRLGNLAISFDRIAAPDLSMALDLISAHVGGVAAFAAEKLNQVPVSEMEIDTQCAEATPLFSSAEYPDGLTA